MRSLPETVPLAVSESAFTQVSFFSSRSSSRAKEKNAAWQNCVLPTVKAVVRFMEKFMDVRFLGPGQAFPDSLLLTFQPRKFPVCLRLARVGQFLFCLLQEFVPLADLRLTGGNPFPAALGALLAWGVFADPALVLLLTAAFFLAAVDEFADVVALFH